MFNWKLFQLLNEKYKITPNNKIEEAKACVKKYFKEASEENKLFVFIIKGIKDNKLISNPIHAPNHEVEEIVIKDPLIKVIKNKSL